MALVSDLIPEESEAMVAGRSECKVREVKILSKWLRSVVG